MSETQDRSGLLAILEWYQAMGVDAALADAAIDWRSRGNIAPGAAFLDRLAMPATPAGRPQQVQRASATPPPPPAQGRPPAPQPSGPPPHMAAPLQAAPRSLASAPPDQAETAARSAARAADTMNALCDAIARFDGCSLKATAKTTCVYRGAASARLMIIGEAPGREEDLEGKPFVGRAGQLLDRMLAAIGFSEADAHITNIVYWRPPGNRTPTPHEAAICRPFLERQIEICGATHVLLLGGAAAKHVLDIADGIMRIRGRWHDVKIGTRQLKAMATLHPAYLLRTPAAKRLAWRDLLALKAALAQNSNRI